MNIRYLQNTEIEYDRWDKCIDMSHNGTVIAYAWYLDIIHPAWSALVSDDYQAVMPLPAYVRLRSKFIQAPIFWEESSVYAIEIPDAELYQKFTTLLFKLFKIALLKTDLPIPKDKHFEIRKLSIQQIDLIRPYKYVHNQLKPEIKDIILQNVESFFFRTDLIPSELLRAIDRDATEIDVTKQGQLRRIAGALLQRRRLQITGAYDKTNDLAAAVCIGNSHGKSRIFFAWQRKDVIPLNPFFGLLDSILQQNSLQPVTLQLADSENTISYDIGAEFGAVDYVYSQIRSKQNTLISKILSWV